jgi:hypothetical protein
MTEHTPDLDERLARLAARKATRGTAAQTTLTGIAVVAPEGPGAAGPVARGTRSRRRHPAAAGRILSVGLSSSAFLSIVAAFGSQPTASAAATGAIAMERNASAPRAPAPPVSRPKVVVTEVHHPVYVDQRGRPIPAAALPKSLKAAPTSTTPAAGAPPLKSGGSSTSGPPASPSPSLTQPAPGGTAGGSGSPTAPAPGHPPTPTPAPIHVSPGPTTPPATSPPATVVTIPPPPPPPACSGTKCP